MIPIAMLKHVIVVLFSLCFLRAHSSLCQDNDSISTILWGVLNKKGDTSYLFGTFHEVSCAFIYDHKILSKTPNVNCLVLETDLGIADSIFSSPEAEKIISSERQIWLDSLTEEEKTKIKKLLKKQGSAYKLHQFSKLPVGVLIYTIHNLVYSEKCLVANEDKLMPMENYLYFTAKKHTKDVVGLETVSDNIKNLEYMLNSTPHLLDTLRYMIKDIGAYSDRISNCEEILDYKNLKFNYQFDVSAVTIDTAFDELIIRRNENWLPKLEEIITNKKAFIAVGYKHLYFREGLINALRKEGYLLFPMKI